MFTTPSPSGIRPGRLATKHTWEAANSFFHLFLFFVSSPSSLLIPFDSSDSQSPPLAGGMSTMGSLGLIRVGFNAGGIDTTIGAGVGAGAGTGAGAGVGAGAGAGAGAGGANGWTGTVLESFGW
jgi:hypothetical protein